MQLVKLPGIVAVPGHAANAYPDRQGFVQEGIVVHTMAGTLAGCDSWFANPAAQAGTHFGVGRDGEVHQYFDLGQGPFAHGRVEPGYTAKLVRENGEGINPNWYLIGIEHDDLGRGELPTPAQFEASARLSAVLFRDHILPNAARTRAAIDRDHILRHTDISPQSRPNCCGWPEEMFNRYIARVRELVEGPAAPSPAPRPAGPPPTRAEPAVARGAMAAYLVRAGDTFGDLAARFGVSFAQLRAANPGIADPSRLGPGQRIQVPGAAMYMVQAGDTFARIAARFGVGFARLRATNPQVDDPARIRAGQELLVPATAGAPAAPEHGLSDAPDADLGFAALRPVIEAAAARHGAAARVLAGIICQESGFVNWRVHRDGTGHGLIGLDDNGLLPDFEQWSGLNFGRGQACQPIPPALQVEYLARTIAAIATQHNGDDFAAARQWHRGPRLMDDERGMGYQTLIEGHVARLFDV